MSNVGMPNQIQKNMMDSETMDAVRIHSGDPGPDASQNQLGDLKSVNILSAAEDGNLVHRETEVDVEWEGLTPEEDVLYFSFWEDGDPAVLKFIGEIKTGQKQVTSEGKVKLKAGTRCYFENKTY